MKTAQAVKYFGSQQAIANALGISKQAVSKWGETVPIKKAFKLVDLSNKKLALNVRDYA